MSSFTHPWMLVGLAAAALPILIHILTRDRIRRVAFSTLRFFAQGGRTTLRRKRFTELLLIALRVTACILAALTFARPFIPARQSPDGRAAFPAGRVIVADISGSMARAGGTAAVAEAVRAAGRDAASGAGLGLVVFDHAVSEPVPMGGRAEDVMAAAGRLEVGAGGTDLAAALRRANEMLRSVAAPQRDIVLVSDLQRNGFAGYRGDWHLDPGVKLRTVVLQPAQSAAVAITDADFPQRLVADGQPRSITVRISNSGSNDLSGVPVAFVLSDGEIERQQVRLPAGSSVAVRFRRVFDQAGDNLAEVRVLLDDGDTGDNVFRFNARVIPRIPVLLIAPDGAPADRGLFFLQAALRPADGTTFEVVSRAAGSVTAADIGAASVVILADVARLDAPLVSALARQVEQGSGLLFLPGGRVRPEEFWRTWSAVAPGRLRRVLSRRSSEGVPEAALTKLDFTHPVFEIFQRPHSGDFGTVAFARYWEVGESQSSRVPARFDDGRPAILERPVGQGTAVMWLSPADPDWNNLPLRAIYLPLLHETVRQLAVRTEEQTVFAVDTLPPVAEGVKLAPLGGAAVPAAALPGFYTLTGTNGITVCRAVNRPFAEADGQYMPAAELAAALAPPEDAAAAGGGASGRKASGTEYGWLLAIAFGALLPVELWVANRTARH